MDAYFQWLGEKCRAETLQAAHLGAENTQACGHPCSPVEGFPDPGGGFERDRAGNLGFFALFSSLFLPGYASGGGSSALSPSTFGHFCCCLSIL